MGKPDRSADAREAVSRVVDGVRTLGTRKTLENVVGVYRKHDLLIEASAIAFRILLAVIPALLFVIGLLGFFDLGSIYRDHVLPNLRSSVSPPAFHLIDDAVTYVLQSQQVFWVTAGAGIAVWEMSGIVRAVGQVLNRLYEVDDDRPALERLRNSVLVGAAVGVLLLAALAAARLLPLGLRGLWGAGLVGSPLSLAVGLLLAAGLLLAVDRVRQHGDGLHPARVRVPGRGRVPHGARGRCPGRGPRVEISAR